MSLSPLASWALLSILIVLVTLAVRVWWVADCRRWDRARRDASGPVEHGGHVRRVL